MTNINDLDYKKLGLKCGLEIHQQLDTNKLFCECPSEIRDDPADKTIKRILRASAGETGKIDIAASHEMEKQKKFTYEYYEDTNCLVELDEEPPHPLNTDALNVVLQLSKMVDADVVDEIHVMRKTVVDGSNTSGFQRTALIARNGMIEVELQNEKLSGNEKTLKVKIESLCLEEDAARIITRDKDNDIYRLDRLGIPLIEIATGPDMNEPEQVKEVAAYLGMLLRSTGKVKRGLGTIRQDVNVSIIGGTRVEIKGAQDLKMIDKIVQYEVLRQLSMIKLRDEIILRSVKSSALSKNHPKDYSEVFKNTKANFIKKGLDSGLKIYGKSYTNFKGLFGFEINPNRRFGSELSDRIKMLGLNGLIHTDENMEKYVIAEEIKLIYDNENLNSEDSLVLILGEENKCIRAFEKIDKSIIDFIDNCLSKEVRNAKEDGTSVFLRPMPGSSRMYPETDVPNVTPDLSNIKNPELIKEKILRFEKEYLLPKQVAKELIFENDFEYFVSKYPQIKPITIAESIDSVPKDIKTRFGLDLNISKDQLDQIFEKLNASEIAKEAVFEILVEIAKGNQGKTIDFSKYQTNEDELVGYIVQLINEKPQLNVQALMGEVMKKYRGKFSGQKILELIKKFKEK